MNVCRSCRAPVIWVETLATETKPGRKMPLDANPDDPTRAGQFDNGNIVFVGAFVDDFDDSGCRRRCGRRNRCRTHFASCPNAREHRRT